MKRAAIYLRVSTSKQETSNQRRELEAVAARSGWEIVKVYEDAGISGAKGREGRPGLDAMLKAVNAKEFDLVATWSVDRLGRSLTDLLSILQCLRDKSVDLFLHQQGLDTSTTAGKAMFQMLGVFAEFERGIIRERVNAGLARARAKGVTLGRPRIEPTIEKRIQRLRSKGHGILKISRELGVGTSAVQRVVSQDGGRAHPCLSGKRPSASGRGMGRKKTIRPHACEARAKVEPSLTRSFCQIALNLHAFSNYRANFKSGIYFFESTCRNSFPPRKRYARSSEGALTSYCSPVRVSPSQQPARATETTSERACVRTPHWPAGSIRATGGPAIGHCQRPVILLGNLPMIGG